MRMAKLTAVLLVSVFLIFGCAKKIPQKIEWIQNLDEGKKIAQKEHKGMLVHFFREDCKWCKRMDDSTYVAENVRKLSWTYVFVKIDGKQDSSLAKQEGIGGYPTIIIYRAPDKELDRIIGYLPPDSFETYIHNYEKGIGTLEYYERQVQADSANVELLFKLGEKYKWRGRPDEAFALFYKVVALDPPNIKKFSDQALYEAADLFYRNKDYKGALSEFQNLSNKYPESEYSLDAQEMAAYCYAKLGENVTAKALYNKFLKDHPGHDDEWVKEQIDKLEGKGK